MRRARATTTEIELGGVERLVALRGFPGAHELGSPALVALSSIAEPLEVKAGSRFVRADQRIGAVYVVVEGTVRVRAQGRPDEQRVGPQGVVGLAHALARDVGGLECEAEVDAIVLRLDVEDLEDAFEDHPVALALAARELARRALAEGHDVLGAARGPRRGAVRPLGPLLERPLDLVERLLHLRAHPVLGAASLDGAAVLASAAAEVRHRRGEALFTAGAPSSSWHYLLAGAVTISPGVTSPGVGERTFRAGEAVGELECIADRPRQGTARVTHDVHALVLERDAMLDAWEDHVGLGMEVLRALGESLVDEGGAARTQSFEPADTTPEGDP